MSDQTPKRPKVRRAIMSDLTDGQSGMGYHSSDSNSPRNRSPLNQVKIQLQLKQTKPKISTIQFESYTAIQKEFLLEVRILEH